MKKLIFVIFKMFKNFYHLISIAFKDFDMRYYVDPDLPDWLWATSSIVMGVTGSLAIATNLIVIFAYIRNKSVSGENISLYSLIRN